MKYITILAVLFSGCSSMEGSIYYWQTGENNEQVTSMTESYFYSDGTKTMYKLERDVLNEKTTISIHYPYFHRLSEDTIIISATKYWYLNDSISLISDSTFEIESFRRKRNKLLPLSHPQSQRTGRKIANGKSNLKKVLYTLTKSDSIQWRMYCYNCDTLQIDVPIVFNMENIGNKSILEKLYP